MKINELSKLTGVTVRTLHYYDEIGLLKPSEVTDAGYRIYDNKALETLQQILFFRELDFPLAEIKKIMLSSNYDKNIALKKHKELLVQKKNRLEKLINLVNNTMKGTDIMSFKEFDTTSIEMAKKQYADEVKSRWGNTDAYAECEEKSKPYDDKQWDLINGKGAKILKEFSLIKSTSPDSPEAMQLVKEWKQYITDNFYSCTNEILSGLGQMYVADERFTKNIDKNGEGTAKFISKAIEVFCAK